MVHSMLSKLITFFENELKLNQQTQSPQDAQEKLQQACAVLLLEISKADYEQSEDEMVKVRELLHKEFDLDDNKLDALIELSHSEGEDLTSMYPLTSLINQHYHYDDKLKLMQMMWKVAYADGDLSKYEDHVIRNVAELLYVEHSDFIRTKLSAAPSDSV